MVGFSHSLALQMHKTELLMITGRHIFLQVDMSIGNEIIRTKSSVRYMEIKLDPRLTIQYTANRPRISLDSSED